MGRNSSLTIHNKTLICNQILIPIWLYGIQFLGCDVPNTATLTEYQVFESTMYDITVQNKVLQNVPYYGLIPCIMVTVTFIDIFKQTLKSKALLVNIKQYFLYNNPNTKNNQRKDSQDPTRLQSSKPLQIIYKSLRRVTSLISWFNTEKYEIVILPVGNDT